MNNSSFLKIVIIILLLINTGTLAFMWMHKPPHPPGQQDVFAFLTHELSLNSGQEEKYRQLRDEHHSSIEALHSQSRTMHERFFDLLHTSADSAQVNRMVDSLGNNQKQLELVTFYHFKKVRDICTPDQQKHFDEVINDALRMMNPHPPGK